MEKGDNLFSGSGEWFLRALAEFEERCAKKMMRPCIHVEARKLTLGQIEQLNRSDWYVEMEELIGNVQRGAS